jgi:hypothetical protein
MSKFRVADPSRISAVSMEGDFERGERGDVRGDENLRHHFCCWTVADTVWEGNFVVEILQIWRTDVG